MAHKYDVVSKAGNTYPVEAEFFKEDGAFVWFWKASEDGNTEPVYAIASDEVFLIERKASA